MNDDPLSIANDTLEEVNATLRTTAKQMEKTSLELAWIENAQNQLIGHLHHLLDLTGKLEIERNAWKLQAEEAEHDCEVYKGLAEDLGAKLHHARQLNALLGLRTGEARCKQCGSADLVLLHGSFPTGVEAPDGGKEIWYEAAWECQECGHREEQAP